MGPGNASLAFALALLPLVLPSQKLYSYPASVVVGAFLFIVLARFLFDKKSIPLFPGATSQVVL